MTDIVMTTAFVACFFLFPVVLFFFLRYFGIDLFRFGTESFVVVNLLIFSYIGLLPLYFEMDSYRVAIGIREPATLATMLACAIWTIFSFSGGLAVVRTAFPGSSVSAASASESDGLSRGQVVAFAALLVFCCAVLMLYLAQVERIALFSALKGDAAAAARERSAMTNAFSGRYHWYKLFVHEILWCVAAIFLSSVFVAIKKYSLALAAISVALVIFTTSMTAEKAPTVLFILSVYLVYIATRRSGSYGTRNLLAALLFSVSGMVLIYGMIYGISLNSALAQVLSRAFTGGITPTYLYLSYFPEYQDYLLGRSFPNPDGLLPHEPYRLTVEIMNWLAPQNAERGVVGSAPTVFWGEIYANFGLWGVVIVPFFVGLWVGLVVAVANTFPRSPVTIGFSVWLAFHFATLASTGVSGFIVDFYLIMVILFIGAAAAAGAYLDRIYFQDSMSSRLFAWTGPKPNRE